MERRPVTEDQEIAEIVRGFHAVQLRTAVEENRPMRRGTHAKGVCVGAVFDVLDAPERRDPALGSRLARGHYARPGSYPAIVRFANSDPRVNTDWEPDVRGMSFSVNFGSLGLLDRAGHAGRQDYSLQSAPTLPFNDVRSFVVFANVSAAPSEATALGALPFSDQKEYARTVGAIMEQKRQPVRAYQQLRYWSNVPFRQGSGDVVKYSAWPSAGNCAATLDPSNPNALRDELIRHLNEDWPTSSFDFGLQFLDVERMTYQGKKRDAEFWIENASIEWPESQSPFHSVATLTLLPQSQLDADLAEGTYIDVTENSTAEHAPVGGVNRARWYAESASRKARGATT